MSWHGRPLSDVADVSPPEPTVGASGLVYPGARHIFMGEPESGKTIAAYGVSLETLRTGPSGCWVALVDFEMGEGIARQRFREMGANDTELDRIVCITPESAPRGDELFDALLDRRDMGTARAAQLVVYDSWAGASGLLGLDDGKRGDIETFTKTYLRPLWEHGITTITLDHVTKSRDGRGRWAIGSERKIGAVDVALGFEVVKQMSRGHDGLVRITTGKDRFGYLPRPRAAELEIRSHPDTHAITWAWNAPSPDTVAGDTWRPTVLMERVSTFLEQHDPNPVSRKTIEDNVRGKSRDWIRKAIDELVADGYAAEQRGPHNSRMVTLEKPYRASSPSSPDVARSSPGEDGPAPRPVRPAPTGGELAGEDAGEDEGEADRLFEKHGGRG